MNNIILQLGIVVIFNVGVSFSRNKYKNDAVRATIGNIRTSYIYILELLMCISCIGTHGIIVGAKDIEQYGSWKAIINQLHK